MSDATQFVTNANNKINLLKEATKLAQEKDQPLRMSMEDQAEVWNWGTDTNYPVLYDNDEDYVIEMDDKSLVLYDNMERAYEEITEDELNELIQDHMMSKLSY